MENAFIRIERREVAIAFEDSGQGWWCRAACQDAINQTIDDTRVGAQIVLVLVLIGFVLFVAMAAGTTESSTGPALTLEKAILEIVEGADTGDILWIEATDDGIEGLVVHHLNPDIEAGDTTFHHGKTRAQHRHRIAGRSALVAGIESAQEGVCRIKIGLFQLLPDEEMAVVGAQATIAAEPVACEAHVLVIWEGW